MKMDRQRQNLANRLYASRPKPPNSRLVSVAALALDAAYETVAFPAKVFFSVWLLQYFGFWTF